MSKLDHMLEPKTSVRRVEVITETGRRRQFSADDKARFVEETLAPGAVVSEVARRHGLSPQQLFTWRRQMRQPAAIPAAPEPQMFVPAVVTPSSPPAGSPQRRRYVRKTPQGGENTGNIELEINGVAVRVGRGADAATVAAVIRALKTCT
ncbi:transposase [Rhodopseudomonas sp. AAP120]|uniref:IS66-like element accessory protein TnpA n=1 Tax=Rhodopseudomonas palustris TaxID=1076 RepID=UPI000164BE8A|nr:transposase [Rhodopseudomonas palustris]ACE99656.1 transposase IS3/IS911 family protein [Rhodopseudomonas palustris TIE-1]KPF96201.1 transposase [Rhodopseudomonas sp. AAP120]